MAWPSSEVQVTISLREAQDRLSAVLSFRYNIRYGKRLLLKRQFPSALSKS